jgi:pyruvate dehydrogenase E1 component
VDRAADLVLGARLPMLPFYIYYSMFGFQRVGRRDLGRGRPARRAASWSGATAGRTDARRARACSTRTAGSSLVAATVPNCRAWDPATAGELAVIVEHGMREMLEQAARRVPLRDGAEREPAAAVRCPPACATRCCAGSNRVRRPSPTRSLRDAPRVTLHRSGALLRRGARPRPTCSAPRTAVSRRGDERDQLERARA